MFYMVYFFSNTQEIWKRLYTWPTYLHSIGESVCCINVGVKAWPRLTGRLTHPKWISDAVSLLKLLNSVCWSQQHISKLTEDNEIARWQMKYSTKRVSLLAGTPGGKSRTSRRWWQLALDGICLWTCSVNIFKSMPHMPALWYFDTSVIHPTPHGVTVKFDIIPLCFVQH